MGNGRVAGLCIFYNCPVLYFNIIYVGTLCTAACTQVIKPLSTFAADFHAAISVLTDVQPTPCVYSYT
jgi:hypothetical protein